MERYELVRDIGSGNFGVARLMRDKMTKELVAVKYIERGDKVINRRLVFASILQIEKKKKGGGGTHKKSEVKTVSIGWSHRLMGMFNEKSSTTGLCGIRILSVSKRYVVCTAAHYLPSTPHCLIAVSGHHFRSGSSHSHSHCHCDGVCCGRRTV